MSRLLSNLNEGNEKGQIEEGGELRTELCMGSCSSACIKPDLNLLLPDCGKHLFIIIPVRVWRDINLIQKEV